MISKVNDIRDEVKKVVSGKDDIIDKVITTMVAGGHILLEDIPGVGKTTLALAISKSIGLKFNRVQFTPDVVPSDITGFTMYDKSKGAFEYKDGSILCNFFLADEINRTSSKTQSALLEVMQEGKVTVDGTVHFVPSPFIVMATQNPIGTAGTQMLPEAQLDRFMMKMSMGYPDFDAQVEILQNRETVDPLSNVQVVASSKDISRMKDEAKSIFVDVKIYKYITTLVEETRKNQYIKLGASPRAAISLANISKAHAYIEGRDYVIPEDINRYFVDVCNHRLIMKPKASLENVTSTSILQRILEEVKPPRLDL